MIERAERAEHRFLTSGIELAVLPTPGRSVVMTGIRLFAGYAHEGSEYLGVAHVLAQAITKGTAKHDGPALNDAFDEIGAAHAAAAGRETIAFSCLCLPEFLERAFDLHAELIRTPSFPQSACEVAVDLARQALAALNDDPHELAKKYLQRQAYGEPLGRHACGESATLERIGREQIVDHWSRHFAGRRMQVAVAGPVDPAMVADLLERDFDGFAGGEIGNGDSTREAGDEPTAAATDRPSFSVTFSPGRTHYPKDLEQQQIAICFPGAAATDEDQAVERVVVGVLSGGMSSRLWTAVRERQGLVYWVGCWCDRPRTAGMMHLGASTTPQRVEETYATLLREIGRLAEDITEREIERAITGIVTSVQTHGDLTRAKAVRVADDLFYYGRPVPLEQKLAKIRAVTVSDVQQYLKAHPRDRLSVVTLGPRGLNDE